MLRAHLLLAWRVMWRRRFFTAISLLGVAGTLMLAVVVVTLFDHVLGPHAPERRIDRMLFVRVLKQQFRGGNGWNNTPVSAWFVDTYVRPMRTPAQVAIISESEYATAFGPRGNVPLEIRYVDAAYWRVMDFAFREGRAPSAAEVVAGTPALVISEHTAQQYFGTTRGVVGRTLVVEPVRYRVVGVVPTVPAYRMYSAADAWAPAPLAADDFNDHRLPGPFTIILLAPSRAAVPAMRAEYARVIEHVPIPNPRDIIKLYSYADPMLGSVTRLYLGDYRRFSDNDLSTRFELLSAGAGLLFLALAALSLVNLTVTRLLERTAEIGVRRAYGASARALIAQFLLENLVLTLMGGLLGLALASGALVLLNRAEVVEYSQLRLNARVVGWGLLLTIFFGLLSGAYPAWRVARLSPARALLGWRE